MTYYDVYLAPMRKTDKELYLENLTEVETILKHHGALHITEFISDYIPDGVLTSYPMALKLEPDECVIVGHIEWPSKQIHDDAWEKLSKNQQMAAINMPFDGKRMIFGSFEKIFDQ